MARDSAFACKLSAFASFTDDDRKVVSDLERRCRNFPAHHDIVQQGQTGQSAYVLVHGWACSYKIMPGGERGIVAIHIPGDFLGLRSVLFNVHDQSIESITPVEVSVVSQAILQEAFSRSPRLATAVHWTASRDDAIVGEHLVSLERRSAAGRLAHLLLELSSRLELVGLGTRDGYDCPLTQYVLADALGLSPVHVNRVLRELREGKLVDFHNGRVSILDYGGLAVVAEFDDGYLDQHKSPQLPPLRRRVGEKE